MTDPQHLPTCLYQQREGEEAQCQEEREWIDRRNPRDFPKVWLPRAGSEEYDER